MANNLPQKGLAKLRYHSLDATTRSAQEEEVMPNKLFILRPDLHIDPEAIIGFAFIGHFINPTPDYTYTEPLEMILSGDTRILISFADYEKLRAAYPSKFHARPT